MKKVSVDESKCICCGACMQIAPEVFGYSDSGTSAPKVDTVSDDDKNALTAMESCPTSAISLEDAGSCTCEECECDPCTCEDCHCGECECEK